MTRIFVLILLMAFIFGCNTAPEKQLLKGNWAFLDMYGNYNEAYFDDSTYFTFNRIYGIMPGFDYTVQNDTFFSTIKSTEGIVPIAVLKWIGTKTVVMVTDVINDTLERIIDPKIHLGNTDPLKDSIKFREAFQKRYENFLVNKGILTREEIELFKKDSIIPEDVLHNGR